MNLHEMNINGCRLPLTICGGNTQLHVGRLAVRAQINREGCLELGIRWNHTSLPIRFLQVSVQFSLLQNTYPSDSECQDFHSSDLENIRTSQFFFLAGEGCVRPIPRPLHITTNSSWIRHGAVETCGTICSSALLSTDLSSVPKPLFRKALNIYSILGTSLCNSTLLLWWSFTVLSSDYFSKLFISAPSPSSHKRASYTLAGLPLT